MAFVADPELIAALEEQATCKSYDEAQLLFRQGEAPSGLYIVCSGPVTLNMISLKGKEVVSVEAETGSLLGLPGLISREPYTLSAEAGKGARLCYIEGKDFMELMTANPQLSMKILQVLAAEVRSARRTLAGL